MRLHILFIFISLLIGCTNTGSDGGTDPQPTTSPSPEPEQKQFKVYLNKNITLPGDVEITADLGDNSKAEVTFNIPNDYAVVGQEYISNTKSVDSFSIANASQVHCNLDSINTKCKLKLVINEYANINMSYSANITDLHGQASASTKNITANVTEATTQWRDISGNLPKTNYQNSLPQLAFDGNNLVLGVNTADKYDMYKLSNNNWTNILSNNIYTSLPQSSSDRFIYINNDKLNNTYIVIPESSIQSASLYRLNSNELTKIKEIDFTGNLYDTSYLNGLIKYGDMLNVYLVYDIFDLNADLVNIIYPTTSYDIGRYYRVRVGYNDYFYSIISADPSNNTNIYRTLSGLDNQTNQIGDIKWQWYSVSKYNTVLINNKIYFVVSNFSPYYLYDNNSNAYVMSYNLDTGEYSTLTSSIPGFDLFQCGNKIYTIGSYQDINYNKYGALYSYDINQNTGWQMVGGYGFEFGSNYYIKFDNNCTPYVSYLSYKDLSAIRVMSYQ